MNVLIVYAHHEPTSFTAAMKNLVVQILSRQGHTIVTSDLWGQGFSPTAQKWDFVTTSGGHFNYMLEQKHAAKLENAFSPDILGEMQKIKDADLMIVVSPLWWSSVPAILKGWFDRVLAMGVAWDTGKIFETGLLHGKQVLLVVATGAPAEFFKADGKYKATAEQILHPINHGTLAFCGFDVHQPYVAMDIFTVGNDGRAKMLKDLEDRLNDLSKNPKWLTKYS